MKFISNEPNENESQCGVPKIFDGNCKIRRGILTRNQPNILFRERGW